MSEASPLIALLGGPEKAAEIVAEVERVAEMLEAHRRGEGPREYVPWLDDELRPTQEWLDAHDRV